MYMTEVLVSVEVYNRRVRCNQVSDAIVAHIGPLVLFLYSFNLLEISYVLPFACNSASFYFYLFFFVTRLETNVRE